MRRNLNNGDFLPGIPPFCSHRLKGLCHAYRSCRVDCRVYLQLFLCYRKLWAEERLRSAVEAAIDQALRPESLRPVREGEAITRSRGSHARGEGAAENVPHGSSAKKKTVLPTLTSNESELRSLIPTTDDKEVNAILSDDRLILFAANSIKEAYQFWNGLMPGVHSPAYNISVFDPVGRGNARPEFPWRNPYGTDLSRRHGVKSFRALWLPPKEGGGVHPIVWFRRNNNYHWIYPVGTRLFELPTLPDPSGGDRVWTIRMRHKTSEGWDADVFSPVRTYDELIEFVGPVETELKWGAGLRNRHPRKRIINQKTAMDYLPRLEPGHDDKVRAMLASTFKGSEGVVWRTIKNLPKGYEHPTAPTTREKFHIVPAYYQGGYIEVHAESCARCHDTANTDVDIYEPDRDWYGRIAGSDTVFSIHPFSRASISDNGSERPVKLSRQLSSIFTRFDVSKHPSDVYRWVNKKRELAR